MFSVTNRNRKPNVIYKCSKRSFAFVYLYFSNSDKVNNISSIFFINLCFPIPFLPRYARTLNETILPFLFFTITVDIKNLSERNAFGKVLNDFVCFSVCIFSKIRFDNKIAESQWFSTIFRWVGVAGFDSRACGRLVARGHNAPPKLYFYGTICRGRRPRRPAKISNELLNHIV